MRAFRYLLILFFNLANPISIHLYAQTVSTIAGMQAVIGTKNSVALASTFNNPHGVETDRQGNVYIADRFNNVIRKLDRLTGNVSTFAGSGTVGNADGQGTSASFKEPWGITLDSLGNVYVADTKNNKIRKITPAGLVSTIAGTGSFGITDALNPLAASFGNPTGIAVDKKGNLYVGDHLTHLIRKISVSGAVTTLAGDRNYPNNAGLADGIGQLAKFQRPYGIEVDKNGNVYVADEWNHAVRKISPFGVVTTLAGNGTKGLKNDVGTTATFNFPWDVAIDSNGVVYVADGYNYVIRKIDLNRNVSTFAGKALVSGAADGQALSATFNGATSISINYSNQFMIVGDAYNQLIRQINFQQPIANPKISFSSLPANDSISICQTEQTTINIVGSSDSYDIYLNGAKIMSTFDKSFTLSNIPLGQNLVKVVGIKNQIPDMNSNTLKINSRPNSIIKLKASPNKELCEGDSVKINTADHSIVNWNTGQKDSTITVKSSGSYFAVNNGYTCITQTDTVKLFFNPLPVIQVIQSGSNPYYNGDLVTLMATGGVKYLWSNQIETSLNTVNVSGKYAVKVTNSFGCSAVSDTIELVFKDKPSQLFILSENGNSFCQGSALKLRANVSHNIAWKKDGKFIGLSDSIISISSPGVYSFDYQRDLSTIEKSEEFITIEFPKPSVDFSADITQLSANNQTVSFNSFVNTGSTFQWDFGDGTTNLDAQTKANPSHFYKDPGVYSVSLSVTDVNGCKASIHKDQYIDYQGIVFIPTGFTPNGDGVNDEVRIRGLNSGGQIQFMIFSEWGELVFSSSSVNDAWDGTYKGQKSNAGNYSYLLQVSADGKQETYKGIITLLQ